MQFYGLRAAKRLAREQTKVVKGQTDDWSRGYRTALKDLMYAIDQEIERQQPAADLPKVLQD